MVDVSAKAETVREAVARVTVPMKPATLAAARAGQLAKGDVSVWRAPRASSPPSGRPT